MKTLNKTEKIAHLEGRDREMAIQDMLTGYRSTPHPVTNTAPYEALMNRPVRTKLDYQAREKGQESTRDSIINKEDKEYKERIKQAAENKTTKAHNVIVGDYVLLKQQKRPIIK